MCTLVAIFCAFLFADFCAVGITDYNALQGWASGHFVDYLVRADKHIMIISGIIPGRVNRRKSSETLKLHSLIAGWRGQYAPEYPHIIKFLGYLPFEFDLTTFSGKLKAHRHINGLSQKEMGKTLGVDGATVCSWELQENQPNKGTLANLNAILEKNV